MYHAGIAFVANYTWVSALVVLSFGISWLRGEGVTKLLIMGVIGVYIVSLIPWHSGPYGRLGLFVIYPLAYLYTRLSRWTLVVAIALVLPSLFHIVSAYRDTPLPIIQQNLVESSTCRDKQLIFSEIQRPQLSPIYPEAWYVGPANWEEVVVKINHGRNMCISQQAIDYPYRQFEGQLPYPLSGRRESKGFLYETLREAKMEVVSADPRHSELTLYLVSE
jgi:hypothetical protein